MATPPNSEIQVARVTYDQELKQMLIDGEPVERASDVEHRPPPNKGTKARNNGRRQKTCGICGCAGHTRATCSRQASAKPGTEKMTEDDQEYN